ncbi:MULTISPECIES: hypothetical protein [Actinomadura]|uniref:Uncharacterized protein n=1 Tax=Actinomadura yumaensis TaxID=111807 RepID=A0ABW2CD60_9ACTN|nr:hypothetical protein [Actinomadura sp. J1-007]
MSHPSSPRADLVAGGDAAVRGLVDRLVALALTGLPRMRDGDGFAFTLRGVPDGAGGWRTEPSGRSVRYAAITALGVLALPPEARAAALGGEPVEDLIARLVALLDESGPAAVTSLGDVALIAWAAAAARHDGLDRALKRLAEADPPGTGRAVFTVDAAWVLSALAAARGQAETSGHFERARARLLAGAAASGLFSHQVGGTGLVPRYRAHVGCFADQVYPIQALARAGDQEAVAAADAAARRIVAAQGSGGQWWWHYDARTGGVVEEFPVYSVHQHAMAPMALLDLARAGGTAHLDPIRRGLRWMTEPAETDVPLIHDDLGVTWRKTARSDPRKAVRGARAVSTGVRAGWRLGGLDRVFPPTAVDRECRPYELGWLLFAWLEGA